ncbi:hypothetical protein L195_g052403 [Trifolium pratense]|uniref:Uncharacterized protein n=1 Tax=Trifolium pratense TaxID=57577 RepID=A0A2K3K4X5_TRIPR|nr:hypothetical protein L195_g052403 [Trifolium pratense]
MDKSKTIAAEDVKPAKTEQDVKPAKTEQDVKNPVPTDAPAKSIAVADKSEDANPGAHKSSCNFLIMLVSVLRKSTSRSSFVCK